jgi:uncharacterized protein YndB with AHSA1/START domain
MFIFTQEFTMAEIRHFLHINAPPSKVYEAITEESGLKMWWTYDTKAIPEEGAILEFNFGERYHNEMKVVRLQPDQKVEWICLVGDSEWIDTTFVFDLELNKDKTILRFIHGNWRERTDFFASCNYHWGYYMQSLKLYCETGKGTPFTEESA